MRNIMKLLRVLRSEGVEEAELRVYLKEGEDTVVARIVDKAQGFPLYSPVDGETNLYAEGVTEMSALAKLDDLCRVV